MIRPLTEQDRGFLTEAISKDKYHKDTTADFFYQCGTMCNLHFSNEGKPVCFVRGSKAIRIDIQFTDNENFRDNAKVMLRDFEDLVERARANGFTEVVFNTSSVKLKKFCQRRLGFVESSGELRRFI